MAIFLVCLLFAASNPRFALPQEVDVERAVCGSVREPFMFWLWSSMAGSPNPTRVSQIKKLEQISFKTRDATELAGYKLVATNPGGYLLVAQGNAMLADQLIADLESFRDLGLD